MPYIFAFSRMAQLSFWRSMGASIRRVGKRVHSKHWCYAGHPYLSGEIESTRLDVSALRLVPLRLEDRGIGDPRDEYWGEPGEPIDDRARPIYVDGCLRSDTSAVSQF